jgi:hypothetical protein
MMMAVYFLLWAILGFVVAMFYDKDLMQPNNSLTTAETAWRSVLYAPLFVLMVCYFIALYVVEFVKNGDK